MFKIGEFSTLCKVPVKTLRYYADIGLLPPAQVDPFTQYRYYTVEQLPRLNRILALRDLGFPLEQIGQLLDGDLSVEQLRGMLKLRRAEIEQQIETDQARLARVEVRLRQIEQEGVMSRVDVVLKKNEAARAASLREVIPEYPHIGRLFGEMFQYLASQGVQPAGPPCAIYHDHEFKERDADVEIAVPLAVDVPATDRIVMREMPAVELATCIAAGPYEDVGQAYEALMGWVEANGYRLAGPPREVYLRGPNETDDSSQYLTEVQFPISKGG
jgi:effector-binding domain-containing protein